METRSKRIKKKENERLRKKLECCEYKHFLNELEEIHEKVDKGDLSDFEVTIDDFGYGVSIGLKKREDKR